MRLLVDLWRSIPEGIRIPFLRVLQRNKPVYRWLMIRHAEMKDRLSREWDRLPPAELRYRVSASPDPELFVAVGKKCASDIQAALGQVGQDLSSFNRILDFGCGCGRTLVHMRDRAPDAQFEGIDIDVKAIAWCRRHLTFANFTVGKAAPPIDCPPDSFDLIYAISVFTHLDEDNQFRWLQELRRMSKPGAFLVVTVNAAKNDREFFFERSYEEGLFPDWYQNTFHSRAYVFEHFGKYFDVLKYLPRGLNDHQDAVVLRKRER